MSDSQIKLVVINSFGPMGASLLASLVEKWGYSNFPIRLGPVLIKYLTGERDLSDPKLKARFRQSFFSGSRRASRSGLSVADRDNGERSQLLDLATVIEELDALDAVSFGSLAELYDAYRALYSRSIQYKSSCSLPGRHIELAVGYEGYGETDLETAFTKQFSNVVFFHLTRDRNEWIESRVSQYMAHPDGGRDFRLGQALDQYDEYIESISKLPGTKIDFEELLIPNVRATTQLITKVLAQPPLLADFEGEKFDIYGGISDYRQAFTKKDRPGRYLSGVSRAIVTLICKTKMRRFWKSLFFYPVYCLESLRNRELRGRKA